MHEMIAAVNGKKAMNRRDDASLNRAEYEELKRRFPDGLS